MSRKYLFAKLHLQTITRISGWCMRQIANLCRSQQWKLIIARI